MASAQDPSLKKLRLILTSWINAHLAQQHIVIRDIVTDLADGQLLGAFLECATGEHLNTVSSMGQKSKDATMSNVVSFLGTHLHIHEDEARWTASGIRARDISSIFVLLVALTRVLGCPYRLPSDLSIAVVRTETLDGAVKNKTTVYKLTGDESKTVPVLPPDNLETLLNHPAKSRELESLLLNFVNRTLAPAKLRVAATTSIDGMTLILLLGSLGNFFVATSEYFPSAETTVHKIANIKCAFSLMNRFSVDLARISSQEIMKHNEKIILRCLYNIFQAHQAGAFAM
ncbi:hypothetical protein CXG81DRAFT_12869 [Caulochytrium protostelioides]|uniref:Calponin-homology (CH) domain-containing protein n=1 Tax=Caulochytrium protostelioides TaxID=1555241 RepID=A0A4P9X6C5_9FUNG|nr:hypothetical protein CXG81DRAFT_12869 [Caulochytrium protostelioides]|eukprot:RKP00736.1 hypothetical protein CXG81DRAFT_12869 [Caulochytrium protostelioides]